ncbi:uncharacterized protein LOC129872048 [Solanum dulcamara]|uniref:uncharacterized protein LOC129872048 n=1 Tax=Solanum dulcamara TaxID=45834 RepID=UPI0024869A69|nr:uncharacterized protein LOC129872048 [Solanum dulcamara]
MGSQEKYTRWESKEVHAMGSQKKHLSSLNITVIFMFYSMLQMSEFILKNYMRRSCLKLVTTNWVWICNYHSQASRSFTREMGVNSVRVSQGLLVRWFSTASMLMPPRYLLLYALEPAMLRWMTMSLFVVYFTTNQFEGGKCTPTQKRLSCIL